MLAKTRLRPADTVHTELESKTDLQLENSVLKGY